MKIKLEKAKKMLTEVLQTSGANEQDVKTVVEMCLEYDLHKNTFSGFGEVEGLVEELKNSKNIKIEVVVDSPAMKLIDANGKSAWLVGVEICEIVSQMAKKTGVAIVGLYNSTYHGILESYTRAIAQNNLVAIVCANGGPQGVVPFGGAKDLLGTNPISYAIPTNDLPIVFDGATGKYPYGAIKNAKAKGEELPAESFLNKDGEFTTDPNLAISVIAFGEHKGYAINLLLEVLTGSLVRSKMGLESSGSSDLGSIFIAIDPAFFTPIADFKKATSKLASEIEAIPPMKINSKVHVPGFRGEIEKQRMIVEGIIEVEEQTWEKFSKLHADLVK